MKTLVLPSWNWSWSMLTELRRWRTPLRSSPLQLGHVSLVRMAYLQHTIITIITMLVSSGAVLLAVTLFDL